MSVILVIKNVEKRLGKNIVLKNVNMNIQKGSISGLIGKSGSGKTTLMRNIIGFYKPDKGNIYVNDKEVSKNKNEIRKNVGFTTQEGCFYEELSVKDNLEYFGRMYGLKKESIKMKSQALLNLVRLNDNLNTKAGSLSGGMKRRLDIAISLMHGPELLIMDEPTTGLDYITRKAIWDLIKRIKAVGVTVLISSHLLDEIDYLCDDVFIMKNGSILVNGSPSKLKSFYSRFIRVQIKLKYPEYKQFFEELKKTGIETKQITKMSDKVRFYIEDIEVFLKNLQNVLLITKNGLQELNIETPDLNEVFEEFAK